MVDGQQRVHGSGNGDKRPANLSRIREGSHLGADVGLRETADVVIRAHSAAVRVVRRVEPLLPLAGRDFPEGVRVGRPERSRASHDIGRVARGHDVLRRGAVGIEARRNVVREVEHCGRQVGEEVRGVLVDKGPFPIHAAVEELRRGLDRPAHLVAAIRRADRVDIARGLTIAGLRAFARQLSCSHHELGPTRERLALFVVIKAHKERRSRVKSAGKRVRRGGELQVQDAFVLRSVRVALLHDVITPGEVAVELAARAGGACDDQATVPVVWQPQQEARLAFRVGGNARLDLESGYHFRDRRRRSRRNDRAVGLRREGKRRKPGDRVVGRCRSRILRRQVRAYGTRNVRKVTSERCFDVFTVESCVRGKRNNKQQRGSAADSQKHGLPPVDLTPTGGWHVFPPLGNSYFAGPPD